MAAYILDAAGFVTGTFDGPGQPANSTSVQLPENAVRPLRFVDGAWLVPAVTPTDKRITRLAFLNRMTLQERVSIRTAGAAGEMTIADILDLLSAATFIDLDSEQIMASIEYLRIKTLLTSARAVEILTADILDAERP